MRIVKEFDFGFRVLFDGGQSPAVIITIANYFAPAILAGMGQILTTGEAATRLGVTSARVRAMIIAGRLPSQKFGHVHMIKGEDLKLVEGRHPGRPPKVGADAAAKKAGKK